MNIIMAGLPPSPARGGGERSAASAPRGGIYGMANGNPFMTWLRGLLREEVPEEAAPLPETQPESQQDPASPADPFLLELPPEHEIGRASCRERV